MKKEDIEKKVLKDQKSIVELIEDEDYTQEHYAVAQAINNLALAILAG